MNCYFCAQHHPGGTNFGNRSALGICQNCGVGVCLEHSRRDSTPGAPLLCFECAKLLAAAKAQTVSEKLQSEVAVSIN